MLVIPQRGIIAEIRRRRRGLPTVNCAICSPDKITTRYSSRHIVQYTIPGYSYDTVVLHDTVVLYDIRTYDRDDTFLFWVCCCYLSYVVCKVLRIALATCNRPTPGARPRRKHRPRSNSSFIIHHSHQRCSPFFVTWPLGQFQNDHLQHISHAPVQFLNVLFQKIGEKSDDEWSQLFVL